MAYFHKLSNALEKMNALLVPEDSWLILINADPDAMACAMALKKLIGKKAKKVDIAHINTISRPDNLTMIRLLRIKMFPWKAELKKDYQRFAIVDSQPHHSPLFADIPFDIVIDHHPITDKSPVDAPLSLLYPDMGACSTLLTELLYNAKIKINKTLATALQYGIRIDTGSFGRMSSELDIRAYHYLSRFADHTLLMQILRSEYLPTWLPYFATAIESLKPCHKGNICFLGKIKSPDILVVVADFFQRVHGLQWLAVAGEAEEKLVIVFRGNGQEDLGILASSSFSKFGSAGGHKQMARAEIPLQNISETHESFLYKNLCQSIKKTLIK